MNFKEIQELIKLINKSNLTEFKMNDGDFSLSIRTKKYGRGKAAQIVQPQQQIVPVTTAPIQPIQVQPVAPAAPSAAKDSSARDQSDKKQADTTASEDTSSYVEIRSPIVGTFLNLVIPLAKEP